MGHQVRVEWYEIFQAAMSGVMKRIESMRSGKNDNRGWDKVHQHCVWTREIEGAAAEVAYAKFRGQYWGGTVNTFKQADVGKKAQVRGCPFGGKNLIVRPGDPDEDVFILVVGRCPVFTIEGWIKGADAKRDEWVRFRNSSSPAYVIEPKYLYEFCGECRQPKHSQHVCVKVRQVETGENK